MPPADPEHEFSWSPAVREHIVEHYGLPQRVERLSGGLSTAYIDRLHWPHRSMILKSGVKAAETYFYHHIAPVLRSAMIPLPEAYLILDDEIRWLLLEDIPTPLPRSRWQGDPEIAAVLARLHSLPLETVPRLPDDIGYTPKWDDELSEQALDCFDDALRQELRPRMDELRGRSQHLFVPRCAVSGDSNPTNWGLRHDEQVVLFDWERFTIATPAIDLAITIGGLSSRERYEALAGYYLQARSDSNYTLKQLTTDMLMAKVWVVVEFLSLYTQGILKRDDMFKLLTSTFKEWLDSLRLT